MLTPAEIWRRDGERLRDSAAGPGIPRTTRCAAPLRAAIVLPIAAAVGFAVGGDSQTPLFAIFGAVSLLITADFPETGPPGPSPTAAWPLNGAVLIVLGTVLAPYPVAERGGDVRRRSWWCRSPGCSARSSPPGNAPPCCCSCCRCARPSAPFPTGCWAG